MGHHSTKTVVKETSQSSTDSYLSKIPGYSQLITQAVQQGANADVPEYQYTGLNAMQQAALQAAASDNSPLAQASDFFSKFGNEALSTGESTTSTALSNLQQIQNMNAADYNSLISQYTNSDLVARQKAASTKALNDELSGVIQSIRQSDVASGNMGSSRGGVAEGVATGKTQEAIANANLGIDTTAYHQALNMAQSQISNKANISGQLLTFGSQQSQLGLNAQNAALQYRQQQLSNQYNVGSAYQQEASNQQQVQRLNQFLRANPALYRAALINSQLPGLATAGWYNQGSGTTSTKQSSGSGLGGALGGIAGAAIGGMFGMPTLGAGLGGSLGQSL